MERTLRGGSLGPSAGTLRGRSVWGDHRRTPPASPPPVFLVGPARSGTSLLYKLLCLHPETAWVSNWGARFPAFAVPLAGLNRLSAVTPHARRRSWFGADGANAYVYGQPRAVVDRLFPMPHEGEPVYAASGIPQFGSIDPARIDERARALRRTVEGIRRASGAPVFVNKRIANNRRISLLLRAFPDARFISLVRDGRAVAYSLSKVDWWPDSTVWWYGDTPRRWAQAGGDPWELCARNWVEEIRAVDEGLAGVDPEHVLSMDYTTFLEGPVDALRRLGAFAGLRPSRMWERSVRTIAFPNRDESWRAWLDDDAVRTITDIQADQLRRHGYALER